MHLADSAAALAQGNFDVRVPVESHDEIGRLSAAFNDMAGSACRASTTRWSGKSRNALRNCRARTKN